VVKKLDRISDYLIAECGFLIAELTAMYNTEVKQSELANPK
jgi:hypothetical protein